MKLTVAIEAGDRKARVIDVPTGRSGTLTGFSGLVRVYVRYDDGTRDAWGTLPERLDFV